MNCGPEETADLLNGLKNQLSVKPENVDILVCPPSISLTTAADSLEGTSIKLGAQNAHFKDNGAFTGEISTSMLAEIDCEFVIAGHSERREYFGETDEIVNEKVNKILEAGMKPIICVGETLGQRKEEIHGKVVKKQVARALNEIESEAAKKVVIAYEPIWAIGTGETASPDQAEEMHKIVRQKFAEVFDEEIAEATQILYGGSMKPHNAEELLSQQDVDGGLIGGASLKADSFAGIIDIATDIKK